MVNLNYGCLLRFFYTEPPVSHLPTKRDRPNTVILGRFSVVSPWSTQPFVLKSTWLYLENMHMISWKYIFDHPRRISIDLTHLVTTAVVDLVMLSVIPFQISSSVADPSQIFVNDLLPFGAHIKFYNQKSSSRVNLSWDRRFWPVIPHWTDKLVQCLFRVFLLLAVMLSCVIFFLSRLLWHPRIE